MNGETPPPPTLPLFEQVRALAGCLHGRAVDVAGMRWCGRCGALLLLLERASGEVAGERWFVPSGVRELGESVSLILGAPELGERARALLDWLFAGGPQPIHECFARFGSGAVLELALTNLIDIEGERVLARGDLPAGYDSEIRIAAAAASGRKDPTS